MTHSTVAYQVMWNRLISVVEEQAQALIRTAFSTSVREAGDLSAGVYDVQGRMLAQAVTGTPGHVNAMADAVAHFIRRIGRDNIHEGDVYITNDPWEGTGHLHDITMVTPSFHHGKLVGFFACTAHVVDIGGRGLGADGASVYEEGIYIPFITTLHGTDITLVGRDPFFKPIITYSINQSDAVTTVSQSLKDDTYKFFNIKNGIDVIPNFICIKDMKFSIKRERYAEEDELILCHVSNFRPVKRVEDVIRIFAKVREKIKCKLILVGDGPERDKMELLCRKLGTCKDTSFIGTVNNTTEILSIADLFLLPSETESFGLAALEAMAVSVPVVSTNTGGIPEVNEHNFSGMLSNVGDVENMAKNAIHILENKERHTQFKNNALKQAAKFDLNEIVEKYITLYKKVIKN